MTPETAEKAPKLAPNDATKLQWAVEALIVVLLQNTERTIADLRAWASAPADTSLGPPPERNRHELPRL